MAPLGCDSFSYVPSFNDLCSFEDYYQVLCRWLCSWDLSDDSPSKTEVLGSGGGEHRDKVPLSPNPSKGTDGEHDITVRPPIARPRGCLLGFPPRSHSFSLFPQCCVGRGVPKRSAHLREGVVLHLLEGDHLQKCSRILHRFLSPPLLNVFNHFFISV